MQRVALKMKLHAGQAEEYKRRHDELWPEMKALLKGIGVEDYAIFLDDETNILFASLKIDDTSLLDTLPEHPDVKRWWAYMADIMDTNADNSPVSIPLKEVFYLP
ncbi:L-rhamnose mutarotase [Emticicia sp. 17c]|uniref:L-rhamnose mutarotase n=1 Tax=Emticicia sp. 17c TaxID=3127704 RepID=UPI00301D4C75